MCDFYRDQYSTICVGDAIDFFNARHFRSTHPGRAWYAWFDGFRRRIYARKRYGRRTIDGDIGVSIALYRLACMTGHYHRYVHGLLRVIHTAVDMCVAECRCDFGL